MARCAPATSCRKQGVFISPAGVRCVWLRHDLARFKQRLAALERKMAESGGLVLTEAQVVGSGAQARGRSGLRRDRDGASGLPRLPGHLLRGHLEGRGADLPADLRRHLLEVGRGQALHHEDADHLGRSAQRPSAAVLRGAGHGGAAHPDRSRHGVSAARPSSTTTSCSWRSTTSSTRRRRRTIRRPTASASASTRRSCRSSTRRPSARSSTDHWRRCSRTWTPGSSATTPSAHMRARCVAAAHPWPLCLPERRSGTKK